MSDPGAVDERYIKELKDKLAAAQVDAERLRFELAETQGSLSGTEAALEIIGAIRQKED